MNMEMEQGVIGQMRDRANQISRLVTELHPLTGKLDKPETKGEIIKALFELTKQVEVVKKQLLKIEKGDDSKIL
jgi:hypothetical protein